MSERRKFTRIARPLEVDLVGEQRIEGVAREVSLRGMFVVGDVGPAIGTVFRCTLFVDGRSGTLRVTTMGRVVRCTEEGLAIEFHEVEGPEGLAHLQRLVRLNAGEKLDQVERELAKQQGLKPR